MVFSLAQSAKLAAEAQKISQFAPTFETLDLLEDFPIYASLPIPAERRLVHLGSPCHTHMRSLG